MDISTRVSDSELPEYCPVCLVVELAPRCSDPRVNAKNGVVVLGPCGHVVCVVCAPDIIQLGMQQDREFPRCEICATEGLPSTYRDDGVGTMECKTAEIDIGSKDRYGIGWLSFDALDSLAASKHSDDSGKTDAIVSTISTELLSRYTNAMIKVALRSTRTPASQAPPKPVLRKEPSEALRGWSFVSDADDLFAEKLPAKVSTTADDAPATRPKLSRQVSKVLSCPYCDLPMTVDAVSEPVRTHCGYCKNAICVSCGLQWRMEDVGITHFGIGCKEYADIVEGSHGAEAVRKAFLESLPAEMKESVGKPCPRCGMINVHFRGHGCHHVNSSTGCPGCGYGYCYVCLNAWPCPGGCGMMCDQLCDCPTCTFCVPGVPCEACTSAAECPACRGETPQQRAAREAQQAIAQAAKMATGWVGPRSSISTEECAKVKATGVANKISEARLKSLATRAFEAYDQAILNLFLSKDESAVLAASCVLRDVQEYLTMYRGSLSYRNREFRALEKGEANLLGVAQNVLGEKHISLAVQEDVLMILERVLQRRELFSNDPLDDFRAPAMRCFPYLYASHRSPKIVQILREFVKCGCGGYETVRWLDQLMCEVNWFSGDLPLYKIPFLLLQDDTLSNADLATVALVVSDMAYATFCHPWSDEDSLPLIVAAVAAVAPKCALSPPLMHAMVSMLLSLATHKGVSIFVNAFVGNSSVPQVVQTAAQVYDVLEQLTPRVLLSEHYLDTYCSWPAHTVAMAMDVVSVKELALRFMVRDTSFGLTDAETESIRSIAKRCRLNPVSGEDNSGSRLPFAIFHELGALTPWFAIVRYYMALPSCDAEMLHELMEVTMRVLPRVLQKLVSSEMPPEEEPRNIAFKNPRAECGPTIDDCRAQLVESVELLVGYLKRASLTNPFTTTLRCVEEIMMDGAPIFMHADPAAVKRLFLDQVCATAGALDAIVSTIERVVIATDLDSSVAEYVFWCFANIFPQDASQSLDDIAVVALRALEKRGVPRMCADFAARPDAGQALTCVCRWINVFWHTCKDTRHIFTEHDKLVPALYSHLHEGEAAVAVALCNIVCSSPAAMERMMAVEEIPNELFSTLTALTDVQSYERDTLYAVLKIMYTVLQRKDALARCCNLHLSCLFSFLETDDDMPSNKRTSADVVHMAVNCIYRAVLVLPGVGSLGSDHELTSFFDKALGKCCNSVAALRSWWKALHPLCAMVPAFRLKFAQEAVRIWTAVSAAVPSDVDADVQFAKAMAETVHDIVLPKEGKAPHLKPVVVTTLAQFLALAAFAGAQSAGVNGTIESVLEHMHDAPVYSTFATTLFARLNALACTTTPAASLAVCERVVALLNAKLPAEALAPLKDVVRLCFSTHASHVSRKLAGESLTALMRFADIR